MRLKHALALVLWAAAIPGSGSAVGLDAFAGAVGGVGTGSFVNGCTTYAPPSELAMFGSHAGSMSVLGGNAACGYAGGWSQQSASAGVVSNAASLPPTILGNPGAAGYFAGTADSAASYGVLGARAHGEFTLGLSGSPTALFLAQGAAFFADSFLASSSLVSNGSAGFVRYRFRVDGSLSALGAPASFFFGNAHAVLSVQHQGVVYQVFTADVTRGQTPTVDNSATLPAGWTSGAGSLSGGSDFVSLLLPMVWGQSFDFRAGLLALAYGEADIDFLGGVRLEGIDLFDANRNPVTGFSLAAASGTNYLPEPAVAWILAASALALARRRRTLRLTPR